MYPWGDTNGTLLDALVEQTAKRCYDVDNGALVMANDITGFTRLAGYDHSLPMFKMAGKCGVRLCPDSAIPKGLIHAPGFGIPAGLSACSAGLLFLI